jgi:trans-aconitate methyltransferase
MSSGPANYNPDDFDRLRTVEDTHFWFVSRNKILAAALATCVAKVPALGPVLEIGCGTGNTLRVIRERLPQATLIGMDAFHSGLLHAKNRTNASLVEGRIEHMPFRKRFTLIGMFDVLEHIEDDVAALVAVHESLETGGSLILTVPANPSLWSRIDEESQHRRRYTESHLRKALSAAQFRAEYVTHFMGVTYPALWASRHLEQLVSAISWKRPATEECAAISRELRVPHVVNTLFERLLRLELPFIRRRCHLPVGTSLLAIART